MHWLTRRVECCIVRTGLSLWQTHPGTGMWNWRTTSSRTCPDATSCSYCAVRLGTRDPHGAEAVEHRAAKNSTAKRRTRRTATRFQRGSARDSPAGAAELIRPRGHLAAVTAGALVHAVLGVLLDDLRVVAVAHAARDLDRKRCVGVSRPVSCRRPASSLFGVGTRRRLARQSASAPARALAALRSRAEAPAGCRRRRARPPTPTHERHRDQVRDHDPAQLLDYATASSRGSRRGPRAATRRSDLIPKVSTSTPQHVRRDERGQGRPKADVLDAEVEQGQQDRDGLLLVPRQDHRERQTVHVGLEGVGKGRARP